MDKKLTTISVQEKTKEELDKLKLCNDESYNSLLKRILPNWAELILELNKKEKDKPSQSQANATENST
jgi:hypothetical protein